QQDGEPGGVAWSAADWVCDNGVVCAGITRLDARDGESGVGRPWNRRAVKTPLVPQGRAAESQDAEAGAIHREDNQWLRLDQNRSRLEHRHRDIRTNSRAGVIKDHDLVIASVRLLDTRQLQAGIGRVNEICAVKAPLIM